MPTTLFDDFVPISGVSSETFSRYEGVLEPALLELWSAQGCGIAANGFLKVIDPDRYLAMVGKFLPRVEMIPVLATGMGDIVVAYSDKYRVLQFRYATVGGFGPSVEMVGAKSASASWLERVLAYKPYVEAAAVYGPLTSPEDFDYIYAYKLPLPAGGSEGVQYLTRSRIFEHIAITDQLAGRIPFAG